MRKILMAVAVLVSGCGDEPLPGVGQFEACNSTFTILGYATCEQPCNRPVEGDDTINPGAMCGTANGTCGDGNLPFNGGTVTLDGHEGCCLPDDTDATVLNWGECE